MTTEERKLLTCQSCNETNDPGMLFCIHCGQGLTASAEKIRSNTTIMGGKCPTCGKQDDLNMRFCIFCSSPMVLDQATQRPVDKFSWEMELADNGQPKNSTNAALKFKDAVQKSPTKKAINYLPYGFAVGAAFGLLALVPHVQDLVKRTYLSGAWPKKSLTVYTKHPFAQVTLYEPSDAKVFTLAETDAKGAVRFVNLEAGDYNMKISGKGLRTAFQQVIIDKDKPTVIGYREGRLVELERDSNAPQGDNATAPESRSNASKESKPSAAQTESKPSDATESKPSDTTESKPGDTTEAKSTDASEFKPIGTTESRSNDIIELKSTDTAKSKPTGTTEFKSTDITEPKSGTAESKTNGTAESRTTTESTVKP